MELIVAVYEDWGIGRDGSQPVALSADRKFFREMTKGAVVIAGRRTVLDFPGQKPLPGRENILITGRGGDFPGFTVVSSPEQAVELAGARRTVVIGGGSIYRQMLSMCDMAYVTKVHCLCDCDTYFPNLDENRQWRLDQVLQAGTEQGIAYEMCRYRRI